MPLEFDLNRAAPAACTLDCVIVGVFADGRLTASAQAIDAASGGQLKALGDRGDLVGKLERTTLLHDLPGVQAPRVLVVGLGEPAKFDTAAFGKAIAAAVRALRAGASRSALCTLIELTVPRADGQPHDAAWKLRHAVTAADHASYQYSGLGFRKAKAGDEQGLRSLSLPGDDATALAHGIAIAAGVHFARELGNLPPNVCNPAFLAAQARKLADDHADVVCEVLERAQMEQLGMGALLAVARGSANAPKLIVLRYNGGGDAKPYALVGKGITFDTGGINLKTQGGIEEMKFDMCGGATVMGTFLAAATMRLPLNLVTVVPAVENMPDADAYRPSDVLTSMSGKTIEVGNTDAEGRLILCDALTYVQQFEPQATIDVATLTGACLVALGKVATGLMSRHDDLADELLAAGITSHDRAWRLPLWDDYQSLLDSTFADVYNVGGRWAGAVTAGCFLSRFTEGQRWAHLDIAGSGSDEGRKGLATGRPVGLLSQWLLDRVA